MKNKKNRTLLTGLLLSALTVPLTVSQVQAYDSLSEAVKSSTKVRTYEMTGGETFSSAIGSMKGTSPILSVEGNNYSIIGESNVAAGTYVRGITELRGAFVLKNVSEVSGFAAPNANVESQSQRNGGGFLGLVTGSYGYSATEIDNVNFKNNYAAVSGGAILLETNTNPSQAMIDKFGWPETSLISNSTFTSNSAGVDGGAISFIRGELNLVDTAFTQNKAGEQGGAIVTTLFNGKAENTLVNISGEKSVFDGNEAEAGGAISNFTTMNISDATFQNNKATATASSGGGAIFLGAKSVTTVDNVKFVSNDSMSSGGAIATRDGVLGNNSDAYLTISNSTFENNTAATNGGALYNAFKDVMIEKTAFDKNSATNKGGAIYIEESNGGGNVASVNITSESSFTSNTATDEGGAIYNAGSFDIDGATFTNNSGANGGAIASYSATNDTVSTIKNAVFEENKATGSFEADGGAISLQNGVLNVSNTDFNNNTAAVGGAIYTYTKKDATSRDNSLTLDTVNFTGNEATLSGGALMNMNDATITNSTFTNNKVTTATTGEGGSDGGGAIFLGSASTTTITGSTFTGNTSAVDGGAIATRQPLPGDGSSNVGNNTVAKLDIAGSTFTENSASLDGGAIYNSLKGVTITDTDFSNNTATGKGGAIFTDESNGNNELGSITVSGDSNFIGNSASNGGAIFSNGDVTVTGGTFSENSAKDGYGGAIALRHGEMVVDGTEFTANTAAVGGAIASYTNDDVKTTVKNATFTSNEATYTGGAIASYQDLTIENVDFTSNKVTSNDHDADGGGALFLGSESTTTITGATFTNNSSARDGGAIATRQPLPGDGGSDVGNNTAASLSITDTTFTGNSSTEDGGAIYNSFKDVTVDNTDFSDNTAAGNGGAIYSDVSNGNGDSTDMTLTDASFTNNSATGNGGAIYSASNVTIKADTKDVTFSGNTAADGGDIYMGSESAGSQLTLDTGDNQKTITVDGGISGANNFNTAVNGTGTLDVQSYINNTAMTVNSGSTLWLNEGSSLGDGTTVAMKDGTTLNTINNSVDSFAEGVLSMEGTVTISADVNTATGKGDNFSNADIAEGSTIIVSEINSIAGGNNVANGVNIYEALGLTDVNADINFAETQVSNISTAIRKYNGSINSDGMISYTPTGNSYGDFNSAVMVAPVAAQLGGYLAQLQVYDQAFGNFDMYKLGTPEQVQAMKYGNKYAAADANLVFDPINNPYTDNAAWLRPYTNFGSVGLKNGPKVDNVLYGTLAGLESEMYDLGNGWDGMFSVYAGYNGSHQKFDGNSIYQNGGTLGIAGFAYKGDFFTGLTANIGANVASADTMFGEEDFSMLMTGVASKSGYNWQLADGRFVIQPHYIMSYSMINTFDYTNAAGVRINSDPLHALQVEPGVKFIGNLNNGWQPYAGVSVVMNFLDDTKFKANDTALPELSVKPYAKYGVGVRKTWGEKFVGFLQTFITSGGRNSVGFQGGFRWTLGKKEPVKSNSTGEKKYIKAKA